MLPLPLKVLNFVCMCAGGGGAQIAREALKV
jgi:hypothetical protein